jgi:hypothetical protein
MLDRTCKGMLVETRKVRFSFADIVWKGMQFSRAFRFIQYGKTRNLLFGISLIYSTFNRLDKQQIVPSSQCVLYRSELDWVFTSESQTDSQISIRISIEIWNSLLQVLGNPEIQRRYRMNQTRNRSAVLYHSHTTLVFNSAVTSFHSSMRNSLIGDITSHKNLKRKIEKKKPQWSLRVTIKLTNKLFPNSLPTKKIQSKILALQKYDSCLISAPWLTKLNFTADLV